MKPSMNRRFELTGNEMFRLIRLCVFGRFVPIGNLRGGPGMRCLAVLSLLHYFGYWGYLFKAKYGHRLGIVKRLRSRLTR